MQNETVRFGYREIMTLLSPAGRRQIHAIIDKAKAERGSGWIEGIKEEYPTACWIIDLAANYTADEAVEAVAEAFPTYPIRMFAGTALKEFHAFIRNEIDRPRG